VKLEWLLFPLLTLTQHSRTGKVASYLSPILQVRISPHLGYNYFISLLLSPAGAHPSGLIGEDPRGRPGNLLPLLAQMAGGRVKDPTLKVFGNDYPTVCVPVHVVSSLFVLTSVLRDGTCVRDYLHVLDLASGHLLALEALAPESSIFGDSPNSARFKAYNLGKGKGMSVFQIIDAMRRITGFDFKFEIIGRRSVTFPHLFESSFFDVLFNQSR